MQARFMQQLKAILEQAFEHLTVIVAEETRWASSKSTKRALLLLQQHLTLTEAREIIAPELQ